LLNVQKRLSPKPHTTSKATEPTDWLLPLLATPCTRGTNRHLGQELLCPQHSPHATLRGIDHRLPTNTEPIIVTFRHCFPLARTMLDETRHTRPHTERGLCYNFRRSGDECFITTGHNQRPIQCNG
jgi:hypothetical protein